MNSRIQGAVGTGEILTDFIKEKVLRKLCFQLICYSLLSFKVTFLKILSVVLRLGNPHFCSGPSGCCFGSENGVPRGACKAGGGRRDLLLLLGHHRFSLSFLFLLRPPSLAPALWLGVGGPAMTPLSRFSKTHRTSLIIPDWDIRPSWPAHPLLWVQRLYPSLAADSDSRAYPAWQDSSSKPLNFNNPNFFVPSPRGGSYVPPVVSQCSFCF